MPPLAFRFRLSAEDISYFIYQALVFEVFGFYFGELFEYAALLARERCRRYDHDGYEEVSAPAPAEHWHSLTFQTKDRAGLRSCGNLYLLLAVQSLNSISAPSAA